MPVKITSVQNAPKHYDWARLVVSTMMGKKRIQFAGRDKHLILGFEDTEIEGEKDAPQPWHMQRAFQWLEKHNASLEDNLLFHCYAGISRSTAMAWSTLVWLKVPIEDAFQIVVAGADAQIWPNLLVIENADRVLGLNGEFLKFAKEMDQRIKDERRFGIYGSLQ
jgi:predicted protein tyrosine phosphatase